MPADFFIDTQREIVFSKATGVLSAADVYDHMDRLKSSPDFRPEFNQLFDFRSVTKALLPHDEVRALAKQAIFSPRSRRAFVVSGDLNFGIGRVFGTYRELEGETGIVIFKEIREALAWLALSAEPDQTLFTGL